jgi:hypothetical protein
MISNEQFSFNLTNDSFSEWTQTSIFNSNPFFSEWNTDDPEGSGRAQIRQIYTDEKICDTPLNPCNPCAKGESYCRTNFFG